MEPLGASQVHNISSTGPLTPTRMFSAMQMTGGRKKIDLFNDKLNRIREEAERQVGDLVAIL